MFILNTICSPIERARRTKAAMEERVEKPKDAISRAMVFFFAAAMARLPETMKVNVRIVPFGIAALHVIHAGL